MKVVFPENHDVKHAANKNFVLNHLGQFNVKEIYLYILFVKKLIYFLFNIEEKSSNLP